MSKSDFVTCNQHGCAERAAYLYTWPGRDQAGICLLHTRKLMALAHAMGLYIQLIPCECPADREVSK